MKQIKKVELKRKITKKTRAIYAIHYAGNSCEIEKIAKLAKRKRIYLIEDAAEVLGLKYKKKICGSFGDLSTFSFYANKTITCGEGGMITTNSESLAKIAN